MLKIQTPIILFTALYIISSLASAQQMPVPGPEHAALKQLEGDWTIEFKQPDGSASKGTCTFKLECGGFWLSSDFRCDMGGIAFQGRGMDGYDLAKKKHVSVWVDSMITAPMVFEGGYDDKREKLTMLSNAPGPDGKPAKWRSVTVMKDKNQQTFDMYVTSEGGAEQHLMSVIYTRKK